MYELLVLLSPQDHKEKQTNNSLIYYNNKRDFKYKCNIIKLAQLQSVKSVLNKYLNSY